MDYQLNGFVMSGFWWVVASYGGSPKLNLNSVLSGRLEMTTFVTHFDCLFFILILFFDVRLSPLCDNQPVERI